jgi:hypothetical protein
MATKAGSKTARSPKPSGHYVFKYAGFCRVPRLSANQIGDPYHVVGVGHFFFHPRGVVTGRQNSTVCAISGPGPTERTSCFDLKGTFTVRKDNTGSVTIDFYRVTNARQPNEVTADDPDMTDTFEFVWSDGAKRMHFVSTRPMLLPGREPVDELVQAEAIWVSPRTRGPQSKR